MIPHWGGISRKRLRTFSVYNIFMKECRELLNLAAITPCTSPVQSGTSFG